MEEDSLRNSHLKIKDKEVAKIRNTSVAKERVA
jgi:hypothetical protein